MWCSAPQELVLSEGELHVWRAFLDVQHSSVPEFERTLADDERQRARRFRVGLVRERYTVSRGILRALLGRYLSSDPRSLRFQYGEFGKPSLSMPLHGQVPFFNLAHAGDLALYAFVYDRPVGIDVESVHSKLVTEDMVKQFFRADEAGGLEHLTPEERGRLFLRRWTEKEACVKADGGSLAFELDRSPQPFRRPDTGGIGEEQHWHIIELPLGDDHTGCVALPPGDYTLHCYDWSQ